MSKSENLFGKVWGKIPLPTEAILSAIDNDGYNTELHRIGLSAKQMSNLDVKELSESLNAQKLEEVIEKNKRGLLDGRDFGKLIIKYKDKNVLAEIYNSFGDRSIEGCGIRVSSILAENLNLELGGKVRLYRL